MTDFYLELFYRLNVICLITKEKRMRLISFIVLILVLWLATWKGPNAKVPAPDLLATPTSISVMTTSAP